MKVREIMTSRLVCATPDTSLRDIAQQMAEQDCGEIPIIDNRQSNKLVGVITDRDIVCRVVADGRNPLELTARDCMSSPVLTVSSDAELEEVCRLMEQYQIRRVPVVDVRGAACGIVSQADVARTGSDQRAGHVVREVSKETPSASGLAL
jgi:CBS domain-containing protein